MAGQKGNKANSTCVAQLELGLGLSLVKIEGSNMILTKFNSPAEICKEISSFLVTPSTLI